MRWEGHVARIGKKSGAHMVLMGKPEGKRPLRRPTRKWEDDIKIDLRKVGWIMERIDLTQDRNRWWAVVSAVMRRGGIFDVKGKMVA
jgi:ribonucleotide reductase beta subunit family protein with ferritin-like domain